MQPTTNSSRRQFIKQTGLAGFSLLTLHGTLEALEVQKRKQPNIILFITDDLGYAQLGCYGSTKIKTPFIDALAKEGMQFTQAYSGSPVCAPSRCVLLTGFHTGHSFIRDNFEIKPEGQLPIPATIETLPEKLKQAGYETGLIGKWGLGPPDSEGEPRKQGFDFFFGYNCQRHAHNHYPSYLWKNGEKISLEGNSNSVTGAQYAPDLMEQEALSFIQQKRKKPFFLFFATTIPHLALQVPEDSLMEYKDQFEETPYDGKKGYLPQEHPRAAYAAMVSRMDRTVGRMTELLKKIQADENTIFIFTSDNGATFNLGGYDADFFEGNAPFRSHKGYVYEGGIRVPLIVRWKGTIPSGSKSHEIASFQDFLPTLLHLANKKDLIPKNADGINLTPTLLQKGKQSKREYLYMEFPSYGGQQMVRWGAWKGVRQNLVKNPDAPIELYNIENDQEEKNDVAAQHPDIIEKIKAMMKQARTPSKEFPFPALDREGM